jgi:preprotein translocase SecF subunit
MIIDFNKKIIFSHFYKKFNILSFLFIIVSLGAIFIKGLNLGVDFKGGTLIELRTESSEIRIDEIRQSFLKLNLNDVSVQKFGSKNDYIIKIGKKENEDKNFIKNLNMSLSKDLGSSINFRRVEKVGPKVSVELINKAIIAISLSLIAMLFYIWVRFEWQFSLAAISALFHDVLITLGVFSILNYEMNLSIVAAILTIVGYSLNDTVVIFDRIRENLKKYSRISIEEISNISTNETLSRTIITSLTTLLALTSIFIFGGEILKGFSFAMIIGVIVGTYSSIFVATPILNYLKVNQETILKEDNNTN